jgi:hypothetical protein
MNVYAYSGDVGLENSRFLWPCLTPVTGPCPPTPPYSRASVSGWTVVTYCMRVMSPAYGRSMRHILILRTFWKAGRLLYRKRYRSALWQAYNDIRSWFRGRFLRGFAWDVGIFRKSWLELDAGAPVSLTSGLSSRIYHAFSWCQDLSMPIFVHFDMSRHYYYCCLS